MMLEEFATVFFLGTGASTILWMIVILNKLSKLDHMHDMLHMATSSGWCEVENFNRLEAELIEREEKLKFVEGKLEDEKEYNELWKRKCEALEIELMYSKAQEKKKKPEFQVSEAVKGDIDEN